MQLLTDHPITRCWPPRNPDLLQLYSFPTPNGVTVSIALEEMGLPYGGGEDFRMASYKHTTRYLDRCLDRPAVKRSLLIPPADWQ